VSEQVWLQDDPVDPKELVEVPLTPVTDEEIEALPKLDPRLLAEVIDGHTFLPGEAACTDCGCPIGEATHRRCGPS
jgi:hypothetical protein